ncbi:MAG: ribbon-helix-helix protein, CopG family [Rhodanobacteraceae bacterium]|nr:ribbon-helix-helix protein, CopG family [Rhodanobacteraceae bacterium]
MSLEAAMGVLTVRNIDEDLKRRLRVAAAERGISMEEHVRRLLAAATDSSAATGEELLRSIRARVKGMGDIRLEVPERTDAVKPADFEA